MSTADYFSPDGIPDDQPESECMRPDDDTLREEQEQPPHVYSPFSPYYNENLNK